MQDCGKKIHENWLDKCSNMIWDPSTLSPSLCAGKLFSLTKAVKSVGCGKSLGVRGQLNLYVMSSQFLIGGGSQFSPHLWWSCVGSGLASGEVPPADDYVCVKWRARVENTQDKHCYDMRWQRRRKTEYILNEHLQWLCVCVRVRVRVRERVRVCERVRVRVRVL